MARLFGSIWLALFLCCGLIISIAGFYGPIQTIRLAFSNVRSTSGFVIADCPPGHSFQYAYSVSGLDYVSKGFGPCKALILARKELAVFYLEDEPHISWSGSNPKSELIQILAAACLGCAGATGALIWKFGGSREMRR
jgi:hypothetical protein